MNNPYLERLLSNRNRYAAVVDKNLDGMCGSATSFGVYTILAWILLGLSVIMTPIIWLWANAAFLGHLSIGGAFCSLVGLAVGSMTLYCAEQMGAEIGDWKRPQLKRSGGKPQRTFLGLDFYPV